MLQHLRLTGLASSGGRGRLRAILALVLIGITLSIGAPAAHAATISVTTTEDELNTDGDCSLREAIRAANTDAAVDACGAGSGSDTVSVPAGTYSLMIAGLEDAAAAGDLDVTQSATITGAGAATTIIDGGALDRVLQAHAGTVAVSGVTIRNGFVSNAFGAGIYNGANLTLDEVAVTGNVGVGGQTANPVGAGIFNGGTLVLTDSTVSGNSTGCCGGAVANSGTLTIVNSTLSGNSAGCCGGGIYNVGTLTLVNGTITANTSPNGAGIFAAGTVSALNTIVANNIGPECSAGLVSNGGNLDSDDSCFNSGGSDQVNADPMLGALADNGGPTKTYALLDGSPAIDAGTNSGCPAGDQRGVLRPQGATCDIGAFELVQIPSDTTPPEITPIVTGTLGNNGWYTSDVGVSWNVTDAESTPSFLCPSSSVTADTDGETFTCTATSDGGEATESVTIKRDATAPTIGYSGNAGVYTVNQSVNITCSAADARSGLATNTCSNVVGPAHSFSLGLNTISASAADNAGNSASATTSFTIAVNPTSLCLLTKQFVQSSAKYLALQPAKRALVNALLTTLCQHLDAIVPRLTPAQKAALIAKYKLGVSALVPLGWLTAGQATILRNLADRL